MGLKFGKEVVTQNGNYVILEAPLPDGEIAKESLWQLWRSSKQQLKDDGFSVKKKDNTWIVMYFHKIGATSFQGSPANPAWRAEFEAKITKWDSQEQDDITVVTDFDD